MIFETIILLNVMLLFFSAIGFVINIAIRMLKCPVLFRGGYGPLLVAMAEVWGFRVLRRKLGNTL